MLHVQCDCSSTGINVPDLLDEDPDWSDGLEKEHLSDEMILEFTCDALEAPDPFAVDQDALEESLGIKEALDWQEERAPCEIMQERQDILDRLRLQARVLVQSGEREKWFMNASDAIKKLTITVNGPMFEMLIKEAGHPDTKCADLFRDGKCLSCVWFALGCGELLVAVGADLYGELPTCGVGARTQNQEWMDMSELFSEHKQDHRALFASLKEDSNAKALHSLTIKDAELGRMTMPCLASECDLENVRTHTCFAVSVYGTLFCLCAGDLSSKICS